MFLCLLDLQATLSFYNLKYLPVLQNDFALSYLEIKSQIKAFIEEKNTIYFAIKYEIEFFLVLALGPIHVLHFLLVIVAPEGK